MVRAESGVSACSNASNFQLRAPGANAWKENHAFDQCFNVTALADRVDHALDCERVRWATEDEANHGVGFRLMLEDSVKIEKWYGLIPLSSTVSVLPKDRSSYAAKSSAPPLSWPAHCFNINKFHEART